MEANANSVTDEIPQLSVLQNPGRCPLGNVAHSVGESPWTFGKSTNTLSFYKHIQVLQGKGLHWFFFLGRFYQVKRHALGLLGESVLLIGWFSNFSTKKKPPGELISHVDCQDPA